MKNKFTFIFLCLFLSFVLSRIAGHFYYNPRPFVVEGFTPLIPHAADNGFPSDHTLLLATLAAIMFYYDKKYSLILWIIALVVGGLRVYAGIHHPIDIVGSIVISILSAFAAHAIISKIWNRNTNTHHTHTPSL